MTNRETISAAVVSQDLARIAGVMDTLRLRHGFRYVDLRAIFERCAGVNAADFEELCIECDEYLSTTA